MKAGTKKEYLAMVCHWTSNDDVYTGYTVVGHVFKTRQAAIKAAKASDRGTLPSVTEVPRGTFDGCTNGDILEKYPCNYALVKKRSIEVAA